MKFDEMKKDYEASSNYVRLKDGEVIEGKFEGEYKKVMKEFDGKMSTRYEIGFITGGQKKIFSGSYKFFENCVEAAQLQGVNFYSAKFRIKRNGSGLATKYMVACVAENPVTEIFKGKEVTDENIPF